MNIKSYSDERIHKVVIEFLLNERKGRLLDVGAGTGGLTNKLKEEGFDVGACDINPKNFIAKLIKCKKVDLNKKMPYKEESFDVVVCTEVIEHIENPWHLIREFHRIIKPQGILILSTPNLHNWYVRLFYLFTSKLFNFLSSYEKIGHITPIHLWNLKRMISHKFRIEKIKTDYSKIPLVNIPLPFKGISFGQCLVINMRKI